MLPVACFRGKMRVLLMLSLCLLPLGVASYGLQSYFLFRSKEQPMKPIPVSLTMAPSRVPENWAMAPWAPKSSPKIPPRGKAERHARAKKHHKVSPSPYSPPKENCDRITCSDPFTRTPIGSPCGCVYPIKVVIDVGVAPILLFPEIAELEIEVAAGTFLKQSQVRIMGADASIYSQDKTTISIYLVPLGEKFDKMTAFIIYERFWQKKVRISTSNFGDYQVISVHYPGLPSSPPPMPWGLSGISPMGSQQYPFTAKVPAGNKENMNDRIIVLVSLSSFLLISVCIGVVLIILKLRKLEQHPTSSSSGVAPLAKRSGAKTTIQSSVASSTSMSLVSTMATYPSSVKTFLLAELEKATNRFSSERVLGEGGFGRVYLGIMEDGDEIAVKLLTRKEQNGDREFIGEVEMLSRLHHRNLVKLIGICIEGNKRCLVYELVRNGSVESHLHGADRDKQILSWDARMKIALGAARGLAYLHEDSNPRVIHRDFKASNVLLEEDFTPKVSDFGLAKEASDASHHISTRVMGTFGYVAPEYAMTGHLLVKSDVYSYGVVLLELLTGRKPVYMSCNDEPENLVTCSRPLLTSKEGLEQLIDPSLRGICDFNDFARVAAVASMCIHTEASQRPFMGEVVQALKLIYNDMDETNEDSYSQRGSSSCQDYDYKGEFGLESSWWSGCSYSHVNMVHSSDQIEEMCRPHSTSSLVSKMESITSYNRSGPLRTKRKKSALNRLRNTGSEHGVTKRHLHLDG
ncbi:receptor-like serine/threonine-protein kinase ALE2 isoform X1 [Dendrobium catenatum]|uniref:receptor-like serine/threonine-protein kinase ALE2 isoform X1 n=1 Tax=Dendrobium catenatum TaxID=906689 RepID=UPI0009F4F5A2|nr:receptor-like serine/threonine-protein kinase ALE2 isoform X1 [Dendrobium catenatum]